MSAEITTYVVYDGDCPLCSRYVEMLRLRKSAGSIELVDARANHSVSKLLQGMRIDLDAGMALVQGDQISHGAECIQRLALLSTRSTFFNRMNATIFRSSVASRVLYPVMRAARNITLKLLGRRKLSHTSQMPPC
jgi:predicted DCC family thiol-disulfide oxidoreductase YuxK